LNAVRSLADADVDVTVVDRINHQLLQPLLPGSDSRVEHLGTRSSYTYQLEAFIAAVRKGIAMPTDTNELSPRCV
jgi:hypothetical protein